MRKVILTLVMGLLLFTFTGVSYLNAQGAYLNTPLVTQEHSQWCWDACCRSIIDYYGTPPTQCAIANWAFSRSDCCGNTTFSWYHSCNQPNTTAAMVNVLDNWNVDASSYGVLTWADIQWLINNDYLFIIGRSGHATVGYGYWTDYGTTYVGHMDPWPGEGYSWQTYSTMTSGWFASVYTY